MEFDCVKCGACCCDDWDVLLDPSETDAYERRPHLLRLTVLYTSRLGWELRFLKKRPGTGTCIALDGDIGNVRCAIYEDRPSLCRQFEAGSDLCRDARRRFGVDPA